MLFTTFAILTVAGAVAAMSFRNLVHSVLALIAAFAGLAAIYLQLGAQFIGLAQVLVYIGAVAILIVFAILLTRDKKTPQQTVSFNSWKLNGIVALAIFAVIAWATFQSPTLQHEVLLEPQVSMQQIGNALMLRYALPLEIIGLLLTAALIGAVTIAINEKYEKQERRERQ